MNLAIGISLFIIYSQLEPNAEGVVDNIVIIAIFAAAFIFIGSWADAVLGAARGRYGVAPAIEPGKPFKDKAGNEWVTVEMKHHFGKGAEATIQDLKTYKRERMR